jgi:hypothetical protein
MKRPQFSLRLMLLVVTLIAAGLGWRMAVVANQNENRRIRIQSLKQVLAESEEEKAANEARLLSTDPEQRKIAAQLLPILTNSISKTKKLIDQISK